MSVEPEIEFRPEGEFRLEEEIPAETCEEGMGDTRPTTDSASQYTTADKTEVTDKELTITMSTQHTGVTTMPPIPHTYIH